MSPLRRGIVCTFLLSLAATALLAQGKPTTPGTSPIAAVPEVVDRNGKVVGPLSKHAGVVYTLPDGRRTLLAWGRGGLGNTTALNFGTNFNSTRVYFRQLDCAGTAYVDFRGASGPAGDPMALILTFGEPFPPTPPAIGEGEEPFAQPTRRVFYASPTGARFLQRTNNFVSYYDGNFNPAPGNPTPSGCVNGPYPNLFPNEPINAYEFIPTGDDLTGFEYPFHVKE